MLPCTHTESCSLQELFPESYAETAAWLRREVNANGDSLAACEARLQQAIQQDPEFQTLAAGCQVCVPTDPLRERSDCLLCVLTFKQA